jgi:ankyrin repeat protein
MKKTLLLITIVIPLTIPRPNCAMDYQFRQTKAPKMRTARSGLTETLVDALDNPDILAFKSLLAREQNSLKVALNTHDPRDGTTILSNILEKRDAAEHLVPLTRAILDAGANPNIATLSGYTPLGIAILRGNYALTRDLIEYGANPNVYDQGCKKSIEELAISRACIDKSAQIFFFLALHGLNYSQDSLGRINAQAPIDWAELLLYKKEGSFSSTLETFTHSPQWINRSIGDQGNTPLCIAAALGNLSMVQRLLAHRADPRRINNKGHCPLTLALRNNHPQVANYLFEILAHQAGYTTIPCGPSPMFFRGFSE